MKKQILVIEDDKDIMGIYKDIFDSINNERFGFVYAESGVEAIRKINNQAFDLLITDFNLPVKSGKEVLTHLKKRYLEDKVIIPNVIVVSGYLTEEFIIEGSKEFKNKIKFLAKPLNMKEFISTLNAFLKA